MPRLYLMRHGALLANPERRFVGQQNIPLSAEGRAQAQFWHTEFAGISLASAICSDLSRCVQTASIILKNKEIPLKRSPFFREICLGAWEGLTKAEVESRFPGGLKRRGNDFWNYVPQGGESFSMLSRRVLPALQDMLNAAAPDDNILLVAHAAVNRVILLHWLALPPSCLFLLNLPYGSCACLALSTSDLNFLNTVQLNSFNTICT